MFHEVILTFEKSGTYVLIKVLIHLKGMQGRLETKSRQQRKPLN